MTYQYSGQCSCSSVNVTLELPRELNVYAPRACDCEFCTSRQIEYLSHPDGLLNIKSINALDYQKQGSEQAVFITCQTCKDVIAAAIDLENKVIGALNATLLTDYHQLQNAEVVSPKLLTANEKIDRWKTVWQKLLINP